jgi:hypothetical protein
MPLDAPVTIATFVLTGESSPDDVARPSICCPKGISLSFDRAGRIVAKRFCARKVCWPFDHHRERKPATGPNMPLGS